VAIDKIPRSVLSEQFAESVKGRRLKAAVFTTFKYEPGFFDLEILPVLLGSSVSHVPVIRGIQLEEQLNLEVEHVAVYYDPRGITAQGEPPHLPIVRIPVFLKNGFFHPKIALLLLGEKLTSGEPEKLAPAEELVVAALSANLTKAGWWENVEAAHIEILKEGESTIFREDILALMDWLKRECHSTERHDALDRIRKFVLRLEGRSNRTSNGRLHPRLFSGRKDLLEFLLDAMPPNRLQKLNLEVISPYFDENQATPIRRLVEAFSPAEVRVSLPRGRGSEALVNRQYYEDVKKLPNTEWARLPDDIMKNSQARDAAFRRLHAKVLRFFSRTPRYEAIFVGSVNMTQAGFSGGGNFEAGFLVELELKTEPDNWLAVDRKTPLEYKPESENNDVLDYSGCPLSISYDWAGGEGKAFWDDRLESPRLSIRIGGIPVFEIGPLPAQKWERIPPNDASELRHKLESTALALVYGKDDPIGYILVREEGLDQKPSLLFSLSAEDILRYWTLLSQEQREAFIDKHAETIPEAMRTLGLEGLPGMARPEDKSMFANYAHIYQAFGNLEKEIKKALDDGRDRIVAYKLLGNKYDSLPNLLETTIRPKDKGGIDDDLISYIIGLCAEQIVDEVKKICRTKNPTFLDKHKDSFSSLEKHVQNALDRRQKIDLGDEDDTNAFLAWFEKWFLIRARPKENES